MRAFLLLALPVAISTIGCSADPSTPATQREPGRGALVEVPGGGQEGLATLGSIYRSFQDARGRPPKSYGELAAHALDLSRPLSPGMMGFDVAWGSGMGSMCRDEDVTTVVIASAPVVAGAVPVLMADGTTRTMTPEQYRGSKKAAPLAP